MTKTLKIEWPAWCVCCNLQSVCNVAQEWIWWLTLVTVCAWLCLLWLFAWEGSSSKMIKTKRNWLFFIFTKFGCTFQVIHFVFFVPFDVKYAAIKNTHNKRKQKWSKASAYIEVTVYYPLFLNFGCCLVVLFGLVQFCLRWTECVCMKDKGANVTEKNGNDLAPPPWFTPHFVWKRRCIYIYVCVLCSDYFEFWRKSLCEDNIKVGANRFSRFFFEFEFWKARSLCIDIICIFQLSSIIKSHPSVSKNIQRGIYHQGALGVGEFFTCAEMELWPCKWHHHQRHPICVYPHPYVYGHNVYMSGSSLNRTFFL